MPITVLKLKLVASPACVRYRRMASPFCREMLTPPAKVPIHIMPLGSRYIDQMELLFRPEGVLASNRLCAKCRVAKSK